MGGFPTPLVCLVHVADNLSKDLGLGYLPDEKGIYGAVVLNTLGVTEEEIGSLKSSLGEGMVEDIKELVSRCMQG